MPDPITRLNAALEGRYRIERQLGEGGMATVYLADDLRHERKVALKVLKPELAAVVGADRFLAEIKTTAKLQHSHILPLHDSGDADGFLYYVMPYVEGESLRQRLDREKQLPVDEAVGIATNVAEALDYAHRRGVIHRDIKPANVLLQEGKPVISDFGIALAVSAGGGSRLTETGLSLGTPYYMSPEQATGDQNVGPATDIYALGCVLYEMLVGEPPFTGSTAQAVLGKIIAGKAESVAVQRKAVPPNVAAAVAQAIEKLPADRFLNAGDFAGALRDPGFWRGFGPVRRPGAQSGLTPARVVLLGLASLAAGIVLGRWSERAPPGEVMRFTLSRNDAPVVSLQTGTQAGAALTLSPDGRELVYVGAGDEGSQLYSKRLQLPAMTVIPGTTGAVSPFFSPDGEVIGFITAGAIRTVPAVGGPIAQLVDSVHDAGADWSDDGYIYFTHSRTLGIARVPEAGGEIQFVTEPDAAAGELRHLWPDVLPGGQSVLFSRRKASLANSDVAVVALDGGGITTLVRAVAARYSPTEHVLYVTTDGTLLGAGFDATDPQPLQGQAGLAEGLRLSQYQSPSFALSETGTLAYLTGLQAGLQELAWVSRDGVEEVAGVFEPSDFEDLALSPSADRLAVTVEVEEGRVGTARRIDVFVVDLLGGGTYQLTTEGTNERPFWTPDGERVTWTREDVVEEGEFYWRPWDASAPAELVFSAEDDPYSGSWAPDGVALVYSEGPAGRRDIYVVEPRGEAHPRLLLGSAYDERSPMVSPDGGFLAFTSDESGRNEVYVMPLDQPRERRRVSNVGGNQPLWGRNGGRGETELFFRAGVSGMFAARLSIEPGLEVLGVDNLFDETVRSYEASSHHTTYDVDTRSGRFLMIVQRDPSNEETVLVLNFFEELRQRVPN